MDSILSDLIIILTAVFSGLSIFVVTKREVNSSAKKEKITFGGAALILLSVALIVISILKSHEEIAEKKAANTKAESFQEDLITSQGNLSDRVKENNNLIQQLFLYGFAYNRESKQINIADTTRLRQRINSYITPSPEQQLSIINPPNATKQESPNSTVNPVIPNSENKNRLESLPAASQIESAMPEDEGRKKMNDRFDQMYARCAFVNKTGTAITMYRGISTSNNIGESKVVLNIGNNRYATTDDLLVGISEDKGPSNPSTSTFKFYFVTTDSTKPRSYGTFSIKLRATRETKVELDKENLNLTPSGERETNYLRYSGN